MSMLTPAGSLSGRSRRRLARPASRRRSRGPLLVAAVVLLVVAGLVAWLLLRGDDEESAAAALPACPPPPAEPAPAEVPLRVFNATDRQGVAAEVAEQLTGRGFDVTEVGNVPEREPGSPEMGGAAQVRHGEPGEDGAALLARHVAEAETAADGRPDTGVDLVITTGYTGLRTPEEAEADAPGPYVPPEGCTPVEPEPGPPPAPPPPAPAPAAPPPGPEGQPAPELQPLP
jgi:hypothetical protein